VAENFKRQNNNRGGDSRNPRQGQGGQGQRGRRQGGGRGRDQGNDNGASEAISEKVIFINRSAKVVKGGRRFSFSAFVVVGDKAGKVGLGMGKANEVASAIRKANEKARRQLVDVSIGEITIPHEALATFDGAQVLLRPASEGTGLIAGKTVRAVLELAGVKNVLSKSLGSKNVGNVAKATLSALRGLRKIEDIYSARGLPMPRKNKPATAAGDGASSAAKVVSA
jgi:small subunit ribosomal protein S5